MTETENLISEYYTWLRDKTAWKKLKDWVEITTPYLDRHNDYIQIYLKKEQEGYLLTDDGYTIADLEDSGCPLTSPKRQKLLEITLNGYGVAYNNGKLSVKASPENFALRKHNLLQAILAVNDMFFLAEPHVASLFFEDVQAWLELSQIRFSQKISFMGKSGYTRHFDFLIPKSLKAPERILKTINDPSKNNADLLVMDWLDTRETRPERSKAYAFLNDSVKTVSTNVVDALKNYDINVCLWSSRERAKEQLAA